MTPQAQELLNESPQELSKLKDLVEEVGLVNKKKARILNLLCQIIQEILSDDDDSDSLLVRHQEMKFIKELLNDDRS